MLGWRGLGLFTAVLIGAGDPSAPRYSDRVLVEPSPIRLVWGPAPIAVHDEASSPSGFCRLAAPEVIVGRRAYGGNGLTDGLCVRDLDTGARAIFALSALARSAGWITAEGDRQLPDSPRGLFVVDGEVWMGSNGAGVIVFNPAKNAWRRFDCKTPTVAGHHISLSHVDDEFAFASYGYHQRVEGAAPSLHVFSFRRGSWFEVTQMPLKGSRLTRCPEGEPCDWDDTRLSEQTSVKLRPASLTNPTRVSWSPSDNAYVLVFHGIPEQHPADHMTTLLLSRSALEAAIEVVPEESAAELFRVSPPAEK